MANPNRTVARAMGRIRAEKKDTKKDLISVLESCGLTLETTKNNIGEWNETRTLTARDENTRLVLDVLMKSDKPDWGRMIELVYNHVDKY